MNWLLVKVFFGSGYLGFDAADKISPILGPPIMLVFVCLTNILLITSLISLMSASLAKVLDHAREEYLLVYSVYVLEAASSNRLTYFYLPFNLLPLLLRPLKLFLPTETMRPIRITLLKVTHWPFVACILGYEALWSRWKSSRVVKQGSRVRKPHRSIAVRRRRTQQSAKERSPNVALLKASGALNDDRSNGAPVADSSHASLETVVEDLKAQVHELSLILAREKESTDSVG